MFTLNLRCHFIPFFAQKAAAWPYHFDFAGALWSTESCSFNFEALKGNRCKFNTHAPLSLSVENSIRNTTSKSTRRESFVGGITIWIVKLQIMLLQNYFSLSVFTRVSSFEQIFI